eukprot:1415864-Rhodomonas_salina.1
MRLPGAEHRDTKQTGTLCPRYAMPGTDMPGRMAGPERWLKKAKERVAKLKKSRSMRYRALRNQTHTTTFLVHCVRRRRRRWCLYLIPSCTIVRICCAMSGAEIRKAEVIALHAFHAMSSAAVACDGDIRYRSRVCRYQVESRYAWAET